jgi:hypothetical protein
MGSTMMQRLISTFLLPAALAMLAAGCSSKPSVSTVKGKVFYNGEPLPGAEIQFTPEKDLTIGAFIGQTDTDGTFEIKLGKGTGMNARPGRFAVLITKGKGIGVPPPDAAMNDEERVNALMKAGPGGPGATGGGSVGILPRRYASASSTPFKVEIADGMNDLNPFRLEGPALKK